MPAAEIDIDDDLVRALLAEQFPDLAGLPLAPVANGWDNVVVRLGDALTVRLPRRELAATLVAGEQRWLPELARRLPLPVPAPVRSGRPSPALGYPWSWSVCPWFPGDVAAVAPPVDPVAAARSLGGFLRALHQPAPPDAPVNPYRGGPLSDREPAFLERVDQLGTVIDGDAVLARWARLVDTPAWTGPPIWLHGDLHPANVLVVDGRLSAVLDFGDLTSGDPATDLFVAWQLFPPEVRPMFREAVGGVDDDTWQRAEGWALAMAVTYLANSADHPVIAGIGRRTLAALLDAP